MCSQNKNKILNSPMNYSITGAVGWWYASDSYERKETKRNKRIGEKQQDLHQECLKFRTPKITTAHQTRVPGSQVLRNVTREKSRRCTVIDSLHRNLRLGSFFQTKATRKRRIIRALLEIFDGWSEG